MCEYCKDTGYIDNVFIVGDLSQAEARAVGECLKRCGYPKLHELYQNENFDIHRWAAAPIFNCSEDEVTKYQRSIGKLSNHSGNYGAGPRVLVDKALKDGIKGIDYRFAKHILEKRHEQLPGLRKWWESVEKQLHKTRTLTTCFGRRRLFFGRLDESTFRDAYSYEPQSTVGDVCNTIFRKLWKVFQECNMSDWLRSGRADGIYRNGKRLGQSICGNLEKDRARSGGDIIESRPSSSLSPKPLIQVHDEVVVRTPNVPEIVDYTINEFKKAANIELYICKDEPLIIPIDLKVGKDWKNTKEIT